MMKLLLRLIIHSQRLLQKLTRNKKLTKKRKIMKDKKPMKNNKQINNRKLAKNQKLTKNKKLTRSKKPMKNQKQQNKHNNKYPSNPKTCPQQIEQRALQSWVVLINRTQPKTKRRIGQWQYLETS